MQQQQENPFPIFHQNVEKSIVQKIKKLQMKDRLRCIAINEVLQQKKALDLELHLELQKLKQKAEQQDILGIKKQANVIQYGGRVAKEGHGGAQGIDLVSLKDRDKYLTVKDQQQKNLKSQVGGDEQEENQIKKELKQFTETIPPTLYNYWQSVFLNNQVLYTMCDSKLDKDILSHLNHISFDKNYAKKTFTIYFHFSHHISSSKLKIYPKGTHVKRFEMLDSVNPIKSKVSGEWYKNIYPKGGFFKFLSPENSVDLEKLLGKQKKDEKYKQQQYFDTLGKDYEIGLLLSTEVIPYSLEYYFQLRGVPANEQTTYKIDESEQNDNFQYNNSQQEDCQIF